MSLIVARKDGPQIIIVSDTKLTYPNHELKRQKQKPSEGAIKTIILNDHLCVSFAGDVRHAKNAFLEIQRNDSISEVIEILHKHHDVSSHETEFLLCAGNPFPFIHKIKDGESKKVESAWIGDQAAFNSFQSSIMGVKMPKQRPEQHPLRSRAEMLMTEVHLNYTIDVQSELFAKMSAAMDHVIEESNIESVGGFKVAVIYRERFEFIKYGKLYRGIVELFGSGLHVVGHGSAPEGAYSINFIGASRNQSVVALHVRQGNFGLVFSRNDSGLLKPDLFEKDEVDFIDYIKEKYGILAVFRTQDPIQKYISEIKSALDKSDFLTAKEILTKAFSQSLGARVAECLFYKGVCYLNLKDRRVAMQAFQEAIKIDSSYRHRVLEIIS